MSWLTWFAGPFIELGVLRMLGLAIVIIFVRGFIRGVNDHYNDE